MRGALSPKLPPTRPPPPLCPCSPAPEASAPSLSVSVDSAAPSVDPVVQVPPPLMSLVTTPPQPSDHSNAVDEDPAASQASLFSSEAPIRSFSDDEMMPNPVLTPSPSIFSFTGLSEDRKSILKNVTIVSSNPAVVEQISPDNSTVTVSKNNGNVNGPKEAHNSNVTVSNNGNVRGATNSNVTSPKEAHSSNVIGPKEANYSTVTGPKVARISNVSPKVASNSKSYINPKGAKIARNNIA